jgi:hypothetical protein
MKISIIMLIFFNTLFAQWRVGGPTSDGFILYPKIGYRITNGTIQQTDRYGELVEPNLSSSVSDFKFGKKQELTILLPLTNLISLTFSKEETDPHTSIYYNDNGDLVQDGGYGLRENKSSWEKTTIGFNLNLNPSMFEIFKK